MNNEIQTYIIKQLQSGLTPADITTNLRNAGWTETDIEAAFTSAQTQLTPTPIISAALQEDAINPSVNGSTAASDTQPAMVTLPPPIKRGRLKIGWLLFTQSLRVIKQNTGLSRYMVINMVLSLILFAAIVTMFIIDSMNAQLLSSTSYDDNGDITLTPTLFGVIVLVLSGILGTFINFFYATALSSHVLDIFRGRPGTYAEHIGVARRKIPAILTYAVISTIIGYLLRALEERFRIIGWIISKILGVLWALATTFVISIIADTDKSGTTAIKESMQLFKANWGETLTGRVAMTGLVVLVYFVVGLPLSFILMVALGGLLGTVGIFIALGLFILGFVVIGILDTLATNILNTSLYYYAQYKAIPPSYSPELLASVFVEKKKKR